MAAPAAARAAPLTPGPGVVSRRVVVLLCSPSAAALLAGCGEPDEDTTSGSLVLTVYTSGHAPGRRRAGRPGTAPTPRSSRSREAEGMVGEFTVNLVTLDDTDPDTGRWGAEQAVANARRAIADRNIIAYIGDTGSEATALTLPLLNEAGVLQIGPLSGYVGLTRPAGRGEPERFYPSGERELRADRARGRHRGRRAPGDDARTRACAASRCSTTASSRRSGPPASSTSGAATAGHRGGGRSAPSTPTTRTRAARARRRGDRRRRRPLRGHEDGRRGRRPRTRCTPPTRPSRSSGPTGSPTRRSRARSTRDAGRRLLLASPVVPIDELPPRRRGSPARSEDEFGREPAPRAVFGYEAMRAILDAVKAAGVKGNDRDGDHRRVLHAARPDRALGTVVGHPQRGQHDAPLRPLACPRRAPRLRPRCAGEPLIAFFRPSGELSSTDGRRGISRPRINEAAV